MSNSTKRTIIRCLHIILAIPVLGYIYQPIAEAEQYGSGVRYLFVPLMILSGYWMWAGAIFAIIGVALWLGAFHFSGYGAALLSQIALFVGRKIWLMLRAKRATA